MPEVMYELKEVVDQCRNVIDAHERRSEGYSGLTLHEAQEIAILWITMEDLREARNAARAEAS